MTKETLARLRELAAAIQNEQDERMLKTRIAHLLGFIEGISEL